MSFTDNWLERYRANHANLSWPWVYWASVPMVVVGVVGVLWSLPVPAEFRDISPLLNWGTAFLMVTMIYYFILSLPLAIGLLPFVLGVAFVQAWLIAAGFDHRRAAIGLLCGGLIGMWLGHRHKRSWHALAEDLQTIMIGPAWLLSVIYRRLGIPY